MGSLTEKNIQEFYKTKDDLLNKTRKLNANNVAIETLEQNFGSECDLSWLYNMNNQQEKEVFALTNLFDELKKNLQNEMTTLKQNITNMFSLYKGIEEALMITPVEADEFEVKMAKFLYNNCNDNLQLRTDPPIYGIYKNDYSNFEIIKEGSSEVKIDKNILERDKKDNKTP